MAVHRYCGISFLVVLAACPSSSADKPFCANLAAGHLLGAFAQFGGRQELRQRPIPQSLFSSHATGRYIPLQADIGDLHVLLGFHAGRPLLRPAELPLLGNESKRSRPLRHDVSNSRCSKLFDVKAGATVQHTYRKKWVHVLM